MTLWNRVVVWLKVAVFSAVTLYLLMFVLQNTGVNRQVTLWVWFGHEPTAPVLWVLPVTFVFGVVTTLLTRTVWRTVRQLRDMKRRRMEKEATAIITRAAKLRVRESQDGGRGFAVDPIDPAGP